MSQNLKTSLKEVKFVLSMAQVSTPIPTPKFATRTGRVLEESSLSHSVGVFTGEFGRSMICDDKQEVYLGVTSWKYDQIPL